MKIQIDIPDGMRCVDDRMKRCKLCTYAAHLQSCNCRLYGRLLKGGKIPIKCPECANAGEQARRTHDEPNLPKNTGREG